MILYSTFCAGFLDPVIGLLEKDRRASRILHAMDGAIVYETVRQSAVDDNRAFNNTFEVLMELQGNTEGSVRSLMNKVASQRGKLEKVVRTKAEKTFRIMISVENKLVSADQKLRTKVEAAIAAQTGLRVERRGADVEFWFIYRREGVAFFMKRLTRHKAYDKQLKKGELHPEIAYLLNIVSEPSRSDAFLDPFCGYGAIPISRARYFPCQRIVASDIDKTMIDLVVKSTHGSQRNQKIEVIHSDFRDLGRRVREHSIDRIVTDPPWGLYDAESFNISSLYSDMLKSFQKFMREGAIMIILTARKEEFRALLGESSPPFSLLRQYDVLVSGKKSAVFKVRYLA